MPHEIESDDQMFSVLEVPWHKLGKVLETHPHSAREALIEAELDWVVEKRNLYTQNLGLFWDAGRDFKAIVRIKDSKVLGVVGDRYTPVQNSEAFEFFDTAAGSGVVEYETAGSLKGGRVVWILARIPKLLKILPGDYVKQYILLYHSHDGMMAVRAGLTPVRVVCNNTLTMAASRIERGIGQLANIRHVEGAQQALNATAETIAEATAAFEDAAGKWRFLTTVQISAGKLDEYVKGVYPLPKPDEDGVVPADRMQKVRARIIQLHESGAGADIKGVKGTFYGAYNAVVQYIDHERGHSPETRLKSQWFGDGAQRKLRALETAVTMAQTN